MAATVLVVDDSSSSRLILKGVLSGLGVQAVEASNGDEAFARLEEHWPIDLVLLDWHMERADGPSFLKRARADFRFDGLQVVMISGESDVARIRETAGLGLSGYILKPFDRRLVGERIAALLAAPR
jgi:two-component system chemotaxis response regulator CheY